MSGLLKPSNPWAPDLDVTVPLEVGAAVDVRPQAFVDSDVPPFVVTQQPANGSVTVAGDGFLLITLSQEGEDEARYTVANVGGAVSAPAILRLTSVSQEPDPAPDPQALSIDNPYNAASAHHRRIGSATYAPAISSQPGFVGVNVFESWAQQGIGTLNGANGNSFGVDSAESKDSDPQRTIAGAGERGVGSPGPGTPYTAKMPNNWPIYSRETVQYGEATVLVVGNTVQEIYDHLRDADGSNRTAFIRREHSLSGLDHHAGPDQGSRFGNSAGGCSTFLGVLRKHEIETPGLAIQHAHQLVVPRKPGHFGPHGLGKSIQKPCNFADTTATNSDENLGPIPYGGLVAIPPSDLAALHTAIDSMPLSAFGSWTAGAAAAKEAMKRLATSCCHYGCYVIDGGQVPHFRADRPFDIQLVQSMMRVIRQSFWWSAFKLVTNSVSGADLTVGPSGYSGSSIGTFVGGDIAGGGTPLAPNTAFDA